MKILKTTSLLTAALIGAGYVAGATSTYAANGTAASTASSAWVAAQSNGDPIYHIAASPAEGQTVGTVTAIDGSTLTLQVEGSSSTMTFQLTDSTVHDVMYGSDGSTSALILNIIAGCSTSLGSSHLRRGTPSSSAYRRTFDIVQSCARIVSMTCR